MKFVKVKDSWRDHDYYPWAESTLCNMLCPVLP